MIVAMVIGVGIGFERTRRPRVIVPPLHSSTNTSGTAAKTILLFTRTMKYRHTSIPAAVLAIDKLGQGQWNTEHTEDPNAFTTENLSRFGAVVFLNTTGNVLHGNAETAFKNYIESGGGFVGVHAAADTEYDWPWYGQLVGAWFRDHTKVIEADVRVEAPRDASMAGLPNPWRRADEWYRFQSNPRGQVEVLASLHDTQLGEFTMNGDHPITWKHTQGNGRSWYTGMGHGKECYTEPSFLHHLRGGILWSMGVDLGASTPMSP